MYGQGSYQDYENGLEYEVEQGIERHPRADMYDEIDQSATHDWFNAGDEDETSSVVRSGQAIDIVVGPVRDRLHQYTYSDDELGYGQTDYLGSEPGSYDEREDSSDGFEDYHEQDYHERNTHDSDTFVQKESVRKLAESPTIEHFNDKTAQEIITNNTKGNRIPADKLKFTKNILKHRTNRLGRPIDQLNTIANNRIKLSENEVPESTLRAALPVKVSKKTVSANELLFAPTEDDNIQNNEVPDDQLNKEPGSFVGVDSGEKVEKGDSKVEGSREMPDTPTSGSAGTEPSEETGHRSENEDTVTPHVMLRSEAILANNLLNIESTTDKASVSEKVEFEDSAADEDAKIMALFDTDSYISPIKLRQSKAKARASWIMILILLAFIVAGGIYLYIAIMPNI